MHSTLLSDGEYRVTGDSGMEIDRDTTICSRVRDIVFRGSLQSLHSTFRFGQQDEVPESSQTRLYCAGPQSVKLAPGTASDPHWIARIEHIGLHSYVHGAATYTFRLTPLWTARETELPKEYPDMAGGGATNVFYAGVAGGYLPASGVNDDHPCIIHDSVPGYQARGLIVSDIPITPRHPSILALLAASPFGTTLSSAQAACMANWGANANAGYNWCLGMPVGATTSNQTVGKWFIGDITAERVLEPIDGSTANKIYQVTFSIRWLPRKQPV